MGNSALRQFTTMPEYTNSLMCFYFSSANICLRNGISLGISDLFFHENG